MHHKGAYAGFWASLGIFWVEIASQKEGNFNLFQIDFRS